MFMFDDYNIEIDLKREDYKTIEIFGFRKTINVSIFKWLAIDYDGSLYVYSVEPIHDCDRNDLKELENIEPMWILQKFDEDEHTEYLTNIVDHIGPISGYVENSNSVFLKNWKDLIFKIEDLIAD